MFGIYLLSDNNLVRKFLWIDFFKNYKYINSIYLLPHFICSIVLIFSIGLLIELFRKATFEKLSITLIKKFEKSKLIKKYSSLV